MKKSISEILLLVCLTIISTLATTAQPLQGTVPPSKTGVDHPLGYFPTTEASAASGILVNQTGEFCMLTEFAPSVMNLLQGDKLIGIRFVAQPITNKNAKVIVRQDKYDGENIIEQNITLPSEDTPQWVEVLFENPITITQDNHFFVGALIQVSDQSPADIRPLACHPYAPGIKETSYVRYPDGRWVDMGAQNYSPLLIQAIIHVENADKLKSLLVSKDLDQPRGYSWENKIKLKSQLLNLGTEPISQMAYKVAINGVESAEESIEINIPMGGSPRTIEIEANDLTIGTNQISQTITSANGHPLPTLTQTVVLDRPDPNMGKWTKHLLLENMCAEWCSLCPNAKANIFAGIALMNPAIQEYIHPVFIHPQDQLTAVYPDPEQVFSTITPDLNIIVLPVSVADRNYNDHAEEISWKAESPEFVKDVLEQEYGNGLSPAEINIAVSPGSDYKIIFSGKVNKLYAGRKLFVTGYFMKESMPPVGEQQGAPDGYVHKHTLVQLITAPEGDEITIDEEGNFMLSKDFVLEGITPDNTEIIAFINYPLKGQRSVLNCNRVSLENALPISQIMNPKQTRFYVQDHRIVSGGGSAVEVFTMDGKSIKNDNLPTGIYIARTLDGTQLIIGKVAVQGL